MNLSPYVCVCVCVKSDRLFVPWNLVTFGKLVVVVVGFQSC